MTSTERGDNVRRLALTLGFARCGIAGAAPIGRADYLSSWLAEGRAGSMAYMHRYFTQRIDPRELLDGARSVIVVALNYHQRAPALSAKQGDPRGRVAMYAWGADYHKIVRDKLEGLVELMRAGLAEDFEARICVDTAPIIERELAAAAGVGWIGKNTMVLDHRLGSFFVIGVVITTLDMTPDDPLPDRCGSCTACLDACPAEAFPQAYRMDASRCISYLTIEHRGDIAEPQQRTMGDWIFGCDVCQEVCPYNRKAPLTTEPGFAAREPCPSPSLEDMLGWSVEDYRQTLRGSAMKRAKLDMLRRNARIAKGNVER